VELSLINHNTSLNNDMAPFNQMAPLNHTPFIRNANLRLPLNISFLPLNHSPNYKSCNQPFNNPLILTHHTTTLILTLTLDCKVPFNMAPLHHTSNRLTSNRLNTSNRLTSNRLNTSNRFLNTSNRPLPNHTLDPNHLPMMMVGTSQTRSFSLLRRVSHVDDGENFISSIQIFDRTKN
jgi:hypothetical protein